MSIKGQKYKRVEPGREIGPFTVLSNPVRSNGEYKVRVKCLCGRESSVRYPELFQRKKCRMCVAEQAEQRREQKRIKRAEMKARRDEYFRALEQAKKLLKDGLTNAEAANKTGLSIRVVCATPCNRPKRSFETSDIAELRNRMIKTLLMCGWSTADIGRVFAISIQRVSQIKSNINDDDLEKVK